LYHHRPVTRCLYLLYDRVVGEPERKVLIETPYILPQTPFYHEAPTTEMLAVDIARRIGIYVLLPGIVRLMGRCHVCARYQELMEPSVVEHQVAVGDHQPRGSAHPGPKVGKGVVVERCAMVDHLCVLIRYPWCLFYDGYADR